MTPEERAFCEEIRSAAFSLIGITGLIEQDALADQNAKQAWRANKVSVGLLAIVDKVCKRMNAAAISAEHQEIEAGGYDLAALAAAPPARIEE